MKDERYVRLRNQTVEGLLAQVNAVAAIPVTGEGCKLTLVTMFQMSSGDFVAVLENS